MPKLNIATAQFPVSADIGENLRWVQQLAHEAASREADVVHFCECALSGYAGIDMPDLQNMDWQALKQATQAVMQTARELGLWIILGSTHPLTKPHKPHNSVYIINHEGAIVDRYDKQFLAGTPDLTEELAHFSPGDHFSVFNLKGFTCSTLICHEYRYPELYRTLKQQGVSIVFHSYHAGNMDASRKAFMEAQVGPEHFPHNPGKTLPEITMPATMISYAANTAVWISCANTAKGESCWPSFCVRPDGVVVGKLNRNEPGILVTEIDSEAAYYDSTFHWRARAMAGQFHSGDRINDPRSEDRTHL